MKVIQLKPNPRIYCGNAYLLLGDWNRMEDVNTLVDCGTDGYILREIATLSTGVGKTPIDQVILTHGHFDHSGGVLAIAERYHPRVLAYAPAPVPCWQIKDGQQLRAGDDALEVLAVAEHSNDSVCLYAKHTKALFSGDTPIHITSAGGTYHPGYAPFLERLLEREIEVVYPGHGQPMRGDFKTSIRASLTIIEAREDVTHTNEGGRTSW